MNERELKYWALRKWRWIVQNETSNIYYSKLSPILGRFFCSCSYCQVYNNFNRKKKCHGCPLAIETLSGFLYCESVGHPWRDWSRKETRKNAWRLLKLIKSVKVTRQELFFRSK
jgi:hypothetical protein